MSSERRDRRRTTPQRRLGAAVDIVARLGDQGRGALFRHPHTLGQFAGRPVRALLDAAGTVGEAAADIVQRLLRAPLGLGDAFAQPVRDAGDLAAQFLEGQGVTVVRGGQALFQFRDLLLKLPAAVVQVLKGQLNQLIGRSAVVAPIAPAARIRFVDDDEGSVTLARSTATAAMKTTVQMGKLIQKIHRHPTVLASTTPRSSQP